MKAEQAPSIRRNARGAKQGASPRCDGRLTKFVNRVADPGTVRAER